MAGETLDANRLTGPQKAAVFLLLMGEKFTSEIFEKMDEEEVVKLAANMSEIQYVGPDVMRKVMNDFITGVETNQVVVKGDAFLRTLMDLGMDEEKAAAVYREIERGKKDVPFNYLEGNTEFFVDGETESSIEYTGTEDIFQGAWYYSKGIKRKETEFCTPYHGLNAISMNKRGAIAMALWSKHTKCKTSQYRFYPEGIPFNKSLKVTLNVGEFNEVPCFYDGVVYWYQEHK